MTAQQEPEYIITESKIRQLTYHAMNPYYHEDHPDLWDDVRSRPLTSNSSPSATDGAKGQQTVLTELYDECEKRREELFNLHHSCNDEYHEIDYWNRMVEIEAICKKIASIQKNKQAQPQDAGKVEPEYIIKESDIVHVENEFGTTLPVTFVKLFAKSRSRPHNPAPAAYCQACCDGETIPCNHPKKGCPEEHDEQVKREAREEVLNEICAINKGDGCCDGKPHGKDCFDCVFIPLRSEVKKV